MFTLTYLHLTIIFIVAFFVLDVLYSKVFSQYKMVLAGFILVCAVFFCMRVLLGIEMGVWQYGVGTSVHRFFNIPLEEYLYMLFAPYGLVVTWESLNKLRAKKLL